jgi:hypothetical protein
MNNNQVDLTSVKFGRPNVDWIRSDDSVLFIEAETLVSKLDMGLTLMSKVGYKLSYIFVLNTET